MRRTLKSERGFSLIEILIALAIMALVGVALLAGLTVSSKVVMSTDRQETAKDLAIAEMEYIKSTSYNPSHYDYDPALVPADEGYSITVQNPPQSLQDGNLQKITIVIFKNGVQVFRLEDYKINW